MKLRLATALALALVGSQARGESEGCRAEAALEPGTGFVGAQLLYRLRIATPPEVSELRWLEPPRLPALRVERLPGAPGPRAASGAAVRDELRALFPERTGVLAVGGARMECRWEDGSRQIVEVPDLALRVRDFPERGRPEGFAGLIGPIGVRVRLEPASISLGESSALQVQLQGRGNLWDAPDPLPASGPQDEPEILRRPSQIRIERGADGVSVRHRFAYDLVPHAAGAVRLPPLAIAFFDPESRRYGVARAEVPALSVGPRAVAPGAGARSEAGGGSPEPSSRGLALFAVACLVGGLVLCGSLWGAARRRRRRDELAAPLGAALAARRAGDRAAELAALERALRAGLRRHLPEEQSADPQLLAARDDLNPALAEAARQLAALSRARFAPPGANGEVPDAESVARALKRLRSGS